MGFASKLPLQCLPCSPQDVGEDRQAFMDVGARDKVPFALKQI